ncbi:MAG: MFS transporter [Pseudanabaena sp. LacPavin_0818_WC45_MAG_42_6]|nr:MFS transporter [Pseudanabaena sp. LacPavin_0818_WC45_MAG_42_6]
MTIATPSNQAPDQVRWLQVWGLASVQGAMTLTWIAYAIYLPQFIEQVFGYPTSQAQQFAALILVIENVIAVIVEPLFGGLSDRWQRWYSTRMPFIIAASIASTALFVGLPCVVIFGGANEITRLLLLSLAILWAIVMSTFRSPVMCLLGIFAGATKLPLAGSVLTLVGGFVASIRPLGTKFTIVLFVGSAIRLGMRLLMGDVLPRTIKADITGFTGLSFELLMGTALISQGFIALYTGRISKLIDNKRLMIISLGCVAAGLGFLSAGYGAIASIIIILFMLTCLSAVNNGMIAFALTMVPKSLSGLTIGMFFGGLSGAIAVFGYLVPKPAEMISTPNVILLTATAFLAAGVGIALGERITGKFVAE